MEKTLLQEFIIRKATQYKGPSLKVRRPKVGQLPWEKYVATLFAITSASFEEIGKALTTSPGVIKKWRTEQGCKDLTFHHCLEFRGLFFDYVFRKREEYQRKYENTLERPPTQIRTAIQKISVKYDGLKDGATYSNALVELIVIASRMTIDEELKKLEKKTGILEVMESAYFVNTIYVAVNILLHSLKTTRRNKKLRQNLRENMEINSKVIELIHYRINIALLSKPRLTRKTKKLLIRDFSLMEEKVEQELKEIKEKLKKGLNKKTKDSA